MKAAFSIAKGLITSGVFSSRGFSRGRDIKNPRSGKQLPAIVRLVDGQLCMALDNIATHSR